MLERLWELKGRKQVEQDIDEELRAHIDMRTADNIAAGMPEEEARRDARIRFGNPAVVREWVRAVDLALTVDSIVGDIRFALRQLKWSPGFAFAAVLMLALGVAANTVIFSVVNAVLLKPLPFTDADRLVRLWDRYAKTGLRDKITGAEWAVWLARGGSVLSMAAGWDDSYTLTGSGDRQSLIAFQFTPNVFSVLGSNPLLGPGTGDTLPANAVCLLDVPVNKTSTAFTKPVDRIVGEAIAAWEKVRPQGQNSPIRRLAIRSTFFF